MRALDVINKALKKNNIPETETEDKFIRDFKKLLIKYPVYDWEQCIEVFQLSLQSLWNKQKQVHYFTPTQIKKNDRLLKELEWFAKGGDGSWLRTYKKIDDGQELVNRIMSRVIKKIYNFWW